MSLIEHPASPVEMTLPGVLDLKAATPLRTDFQTARGQDITIDAEQVERLGGQCLQVMLAAKAAWATDGCRLQVVRPSSAFTEALALFGAAGEFDTKE